jgi:hypothetical protein
VFQKPLDNHYNTYQTGNHNFAVMSPHPILKYHIIIDNATPKSMERATDDEIATATVVHPHDLPIHPVAFRKPFNTDKESVNDKKHRVRQFAKAAKIYADMLSAGIKNVDDPKELDRILDYMHRAQTVTYFCIEKVYNATPRADRDAWMRTGDDAPVKGHSTQ